MKLDRIYPLLFAIFPTLFLYTYNISLFKETALILPLELSLGIALAIYLLCLTLIRKWSVAAITSSFVILMFFSYSRVRFLFSSIHFSIGTLFIGPDKTLFFLILFFAMVITHRCLHHQNLTQKVNRALKIVSVMLIGVTLVNTLYSEIRLGRLFVTQEKPKSKQVLGVTTAATPDIYYFILDRYGGEKTINYYGFDNSQFYNFLRGKGFYVATDATSNYPKTLLSLTSSLNMDYDDFLTQKTKGGATSDESIAVPYLQNNKVLQFLTGHGYTSIQIGSNWDPTRSNPYADQNFTMTGGRYPFGDEFTIGLTQTTLMSPILNKIYPDTTAVSQDPKNNEYRSRILYEFNIFSQIVKIPEPKFVFTHILIPHGPYVLGSNCEPLPESVTATRNEKENYLNQLQCGDKKTEAVINEILSTSKTKPIIIIQADEGPLPIINPVSYKLEWKNASDATLNEKFPILSAYLLPDFPDKQLYPAITPVNSFRLIFNHYFEANLPLLPDRNMIFEDDQHIYQFSDVTSRIVHTPWKN